MANQTPKHGDGQALGRGAAPAPGHAGHVPPERHAWKCHAAVVLFLIITAAGAAADLISKDAVFRSFLDNPQLPARVEQIRDERIRMGESASARDVIHDARMLNFLQYRIMPGVKFTLSTNPGIVFGSQVIPRWAVNSATVLTILLVIVFFATSDRGAWLTHVALACIVGGAIGNLYDRLFAVVNLPAGLEPIRCEVRDFIDLGDIGYVWVFNVADALLVVGVILIIMGWIIAARKKPAPAAKAA